MTKIDFSRFAVASLLAGGLLALTALPSSALTLSSTSLVDRGDQPAIQKVWYDQWGEWHPNHRHYGHRVADPDPHHMEGHRRCWAAGPNGTVFCRNVDEY